MAQKSKSRSRLLITLVGLTSLLSSCAQTPSIITRRYVGFDTSLYFEYEGEKEFQDTLVSPINKMSDLFDTYKVIPDINNAYLINHSDVFVTVDKDLFDVLSQADGYYQETNGLFNPLIKDLSELWKASLKAGNLPSNDEINSLLEKINTSSLEFSGTDKVKISGEGQIDLGAIAKGYALSKIRKIIEENKITNYIFNAGYSSIILGENNKNDGIFRVQIMREKPTFDELYLEVKNTSIGTSSIYEQNYLEKDGKIYSHIVNGITGSAEVKHHMVIVVSEDPIISDVYSTVGMMLSIDEIKELEEDIDAKFVTLSDGKVTYSNPSIEVHKR